MMNKLVYRYSFIAALLLASMLGFSQQDPLFTQYMNNPGLINPAYAGSKGNVNINGTFRKQWVGMDWSPMTTTLSVNSPFMNYDIGLGFTFVDDQIGPWHQTGIYFDYARYLRFSNNRNLSLGIKAGINFIDVNLANLIMNNPYDPVVSANPRYTRPLPNFGIGAYYFTNDYFIGFSIPKLVRNSIQSKDNTLEVLGREERHYFLTAGYLFVIDDPAWKLKPTMMTRIVNGSPVSLELGLTAIFFDRVWFGLAYRVGDAFAGHLRFQVNDRLQLGYSYDLNNSRLKAYNSGSHEIFLSYDFAFRGRRILSPRYF